MTISYKYRARFLGNDGDVALRRRTPREWLERGDAFAAQGRTLQAIGAYGKAVDRGDRDVAAPAAYRWGLLTKRMGYRDTAEKLLQRAVGYDHPDHSTRARFALAGIHRELGRVDDAVLGYRAVAGSGHAEVAPAATLILGELLEERGDPDGAMERYEAAAASGHRDVAAKAWCNVGALRLRNGDEPGAAEAYREAAESDDPEAARHATRVLRQLSAAPPASNGDYGLLHAANGTVTGFVFTDRTYGAKVAEDSGLVEAFLAKHELWHLVMSAYRGYPDKAGYVIEFTQT